MTIPYGWLSAKYAEFCQYTWRIIRWLRTWGNSCRLQLAAFIPGKLSWKCIHIFANRHLLIVLYRRFHKCYNNDHSIRMAYCKICRILYRMTALNGNIFGVTGHMWSESTGHQLIPHTKSSDGELWCFLWPAPEQTVEQTIEVLVNWDSIVFMMSSL